MRCAYDVRPKSYMYRNWRAPTPFEAFVFGFGNHLRRTTGCLYVAEEVSGPRSWDTVCVSGPDLQLCAPVPASARLKNTRMLIRFLSIRFLSSLPLIRRLGTCPEALVKSHRQRDKGRTNSVHPSQVRPSAREDSVLYLTWEKREHTIQFKTVWRAAHNTRGHMLRRKIDSNKPRG
jgi:hypothetical protein